MAPICYICKSNVPNTKSIFRIPDRHDEYCERGSLWLKILNAEAENVDSIRICSEHFLQGKPAKKGDFLNIDWVPNQNLGRLSKNHDYITKYFDEKKAAMAEQYVNRSEINENYHDESISTDECVQEEPRKVDSQVNVGSQEVQYKHKNLRAVDAGNNYGLLIPPLKKRKIEIIREQFFLHKEIQTDLTAGDINALFLYFKNAVEERREMLVKISNLVIDIDFFKGNDQKTRFYTGFTTWSLLKNFYELVKNYLPSHFNSKLSTFQILVMTLMKLRLNFNFTDLGYRFQVDRTTISTNFHRCIYILFKLFHKSKIIRWPKREHIILNTPSYFRSAFKEQIIIIIDCFEIVIEKAGNLRARAQAYSKYKHRTTIKYLIGITTTGVIIFISDAFGGRASDKFITLKSALLDNLQDGDIVLSDKGFLIESEVEATGAFLRMPSFVRNGNQLHPTEVEKSRHISSIRIHVETVISTLRQKFNICSDIAPMAALSKHNDLFDNDLYNIIVFLCCSFINLCPSVVSNDFEI